MKKKVNKIFIFSLVFLLGIINVNAALSCGITLKYASGQGIYDKIGDVVEYVCKDYGDKYTYNIVKSSCAVSGGSTCSGDYKLESNPRTDASFHSGKAAYDGCLDLPGVESWDSTGWSKMNTSAAIYYAGIGNGQSQMGLFPYKNGETDDGTGCDKDKIDGEGTCSYTYTYSVGWDTCGGDCKKYSENEDGSKGDCAEYYPTYKCCKYGHYEGCGDCCQTDALDFTYSKDIDYDTVLSDVTDACESQSAVDSGSCSCKLDTYIMVETYDKYCKSPKLDIIDANAWHFISPTTGSSAYCVNEGKHFGAPGENSDNYQWESTFDITKCKSSLSALDSDGNLVDESSLSGSHTYEDGSSISANENSRKVCGYANILVMGKYLNYSDAIVNAAMRLFAIHEDSKYDYMRASGFNAGLGLPWYQIITPNERGAGKWCGRVFDDAHDMHKSLNEFNQYISTYNFLKYNKRIANASDSSNWDGTWKGEVFGGKDISEIKGPEDLKTVACNTKNEDNVGQWCGEYQDYLKSIYLFVNTIQGNDRLQYYLNKLVGEETVQYEPAFVRTSISKEVVNNWGELTITAEMTDKVEVECDVNDPSTREYCRVEKIYVDIGGSEVSLGEYPNYYDYCKKNYCYKTVKYYMEVCTNSASGGVPGTANVSIVTKKSKAQKAVKKLTPCKNVTESQNMYTLDIGAKIENSHPIKTKVVDNKPYDLDLFSVVETSQTIQICSCGDDTCRTSNKKYLLITTPDGQTYTDVNQAKGKNNCAGYNKFREGNYNSYAYSKVEDPTMNCIINMCYPADKAKYDYSGYYGVNTDVCRVYCRDEVHMFMADKTTAYAGMQFKYDIAGKVFEGRPKVNDPALTTIVVELRQCVSDIYYNKPNEDGKTWKDLFDVANNKHKNKNEVAQLIIDLENCNLLETVDANGFIGKYNNVHQPLYGKKDLSDPNLNTTKQLINSLYNNSNDGDESKNCNGNACVTATVEYEETITLNNSDDLIYIYPVTYCTGSNCLKYSGKGDTTKANLDGGYDTTSISSVIGNVTIPTNDYAQVKIKYEVDLYNPNLYEVDPYTGRYSEVTGTSERIQLDPYSYPVSLESQTNVYPIKYQFNIKTFYRNTTNQDGFEKVLTGDGALARYTCGYDVYNNTVKYPTKCYYVTNGVPDILKRTDCPDDTPNGIRYGFVYRNIDLANVFPNPRGYDTNWSTEVGKETVKSVEDSASDLQTTTKYLQYSYTLDPEAIKSIKNDYNSLHDGVGYINNTLKNCEIVTTPSGKSSYRNCKSDFIEEIANPTNKYGIKVNKGDGVKTGGSN